MSSTASGSSTSHDSMELSTSQTPRRTRSNVWGHYEQNLVDVDGDLKAVCKYCGIHLNTKSGTSSLGGFIASACPAISTPIRQKNSKPLSVSNPQQNLLYLTPKFVVER